MSTERVLFEGRLGTERVRVWLQASGAGIELLSHDIGPGLEQFFGRDEIETYLRIDAAHEPFLTDALAAERTDPGAPTTALDLLADKYRGDAAATTHLKAWLDEHEVPYRFTLV